MTKGVEYVTYNRDDIWEYGGQYVDGRFTCYTLKLLKPPGPPTVDYLHKKEAQRQKCYEAYRDFGVESEQYKEASRRFHSPHILD